MARKMMRRFEVDVGTKAAVSMTKKTKKIAAANGS
jgi:hypothetical protein